MRLEEETIDRYLNEDRNSGWQKNFVNMMGTEEGVSILSQTLDKDANAVTEENTEKWLNHEIPSEKMKARFFSAIKKPRKRFFWLKVAAIVIPFIFLSGSVFFLSERLGVFSEPEYESIVVPCGEQIQVVLQDGTKVQLNSASKLRYPKNFGLFSRKVELSGEAYFSVTKDRDRPFIVDLKGVAVRVLGTQFNVKAYKEEPFVHVMLDKGSVQLEDLIDHAYSLKPGETAGYDRRNGSCVITKIKNKDDIVGWRSHSLNFYHVQLFEILKTLERQYDINFIVRDKNLLKVRFTLSTSKMQITDILKDLEKVSFVQFSDTDSHHTFVVSSKIK